MAAVSLFWDTSMAAVTLCENTVDTVTGGNDVGVHLVLMQPFLL